MPDMLQARRINTAQVLNVPPSIPPFNMKDPGRTVSEEMAGSKKCCDQEDEYGRPPGRRDKDAAQRR